MTGTKLGRALALTAAVAAAFVTPARAEPRIANVSQGTDMAVALTPDGGSLIVDLLGRLWRLPATGGAARQLTPDDESARFPRVDPAGRLVVYERRRADDHDLWLLELDSGERRPLLEGEADDRQPDFSADGSRVVFVSDRTGHDCLWSVGVDDGVLTQLTEEPGDAAFPSVSERDEIVYVRREADADALRVLTQNGAAIEVLRSPHRLNAPTWRPGGGVLLFNEVTPPADGEIGSSELRMLVLSEDPVVRSLTRAEDVFAARAAWISPGRYVYTADGQIWRRGIGQVSRQPVHLFAAVTVENRAPAPISRPLDSPTEQPVSGVAGSSGSADGKIRVFAALGDLWLDAGRGDARRLTDDVFVDFDPSVSQAGDFAVFVSDRSGFLDLWRISLPGGTLQQLTNREDKAYRPALSPDGRSVAFLETLGSDDRGPAALRVLDIATRRVTHTPATDLRATDRLSWIDDSALNIDVGSREGGAGAARLTVRVDGSGRASVPQSEPMPDEDAAAAGDEPPTRSALSWQPQANRQNFVVQAGRLFDGVGSDYRRHVDIHVEGQKITAIVARGLLPLPETVIDARDQTVMPGLIDAHVHQSNLLGQRLGRMWLTHGVTTVRELTDDVPAALERAESWSSGRRPGPRLIVSPLDSGRTRQRSYDVATPVRTYATLSPTWLLFGGPSSHRANGEPIDALAAVGVPSRLSPLGLTYEDMFNVIVESGTVVTSELATGAGIGAGAARFLKLLRRSAMQRLATPAELEAWTHVTQAGTVDAVGRNAARLIRAGGRLGVGSDAPDVPFGLGVHLELALLADAGVPADQALRLATASNALALGLEQQLGTIEPGKLADFVIVDGNPLTNLADALNVVAVVRGGTRFDRAALLDAL